MGGGVARPWGQVEFGGDGTSEGERGVIIAGDGDAEGTFEVEEPGVPVPVLPHRDQQRVGRQVGADVVRGR